MSVIAAIGGQEEVHQGRVEQVHISHTGDHLAADAGIGASTLTLYDVSDFSETGGQLSINGVVYDYLSTNDELATITLVGTLSVAAVTDDPVLLYPPSEEKVAAVQLLTGDDAIFAKIPHYMQDRFADGIRDAEASESVLVRLENNEWLLSDVVAKAPEIETSFIGSDGIAPLTGVVATVTGGPGFTVLSWTPIENADMPMYTVYGSTTPGFTADVTTQLGEPTAGSFFVHRPDPPDYAATYYYKVGVSDVDGAGPLSAEVSTQLKQITNPDISVGYVYAGNIIVDQLLGGTLAADVLLSSNIRTALAGARTEVNAFGITIYDSAGTPDTTLSPETKMFKGDAEIQGLTVTDTMAIRNLAEVSKGAVLTLANASTQPQAAPTVVIDWEYATPETGGWWVNGFYHYDNKLWVVKDLSTGPRISGYAKTGGAATNNLDLSGGVASRPWGGLAHLGGVGGSWYTLGWQLVTGLYRWYITKYDDVTGVMETQVSYTPIGTGFYNTSSATAAIGSDGTNILIAEFDEANDRYRIQVRDATTLAVSSTVNTGSNSGFTGPVTGIQGGNFDFGAFRYIVTSRNGGHHYPFQSGGTYNSLESFNVPLIGSMQGCTWDGTRFWSRSIGSDVEHSKFFKHYAHKWDDAGSTVTWYTVDTWYDSDATGGTHESMMSSARSFSMYKRARITLTSPTIPDAGGTDDPTRPRFYLSKTNTARTSFFLQTEPADGVRTISLGDTITFTGTNPPATNDFPSATPGAVWSAATFAGDTLPYTMLKGDGTGRLLEVMVGHFVRKLVTESVVGSTAQQNDDSLLFTAMANALYLIDLVLFVNTNNENDMKVGWSLPAGATFNMQRAGHTTTISGTTVGSIGLDALTGSTAGTLQLGIPNTTTVGPTMGFKLSTLIAMGGTAGVCNLQWSQLVSGNTLSILSNSWLHAKRVSM